MSKSKEELNALKEEVESISEKLKELTPEELEQVNGGAKEAAIHMGVKAFTGVVLVGGSQCN